MLDGGSQEVAILEEVAVDADLAVFSVTLKQEEGSILHAKLKARF